MRKISTKSAYCQILALCFLNRLYDMESNKLAKKLFCGLVELDQQDFETWASGPLFTKKTPSYQYRDSHYKPETVVRPS